MGFLECLITFIKPTAIEEWDINEMAFLRSLYSDKDLINEDAEAKYVLYHSIVSVAVRTNSQLKIINQTSTAYQYSSYSIYEAIQLYLGTKYRSKMNQFQ
jgi:hypothetical protein